MTAWDNRIVGHGEVDPTQLLANPLNWRIHPQAQQEALEGVLTDVGWVDEVIVNKRSGFVIDGHLRVALAIRDEQATIPVKYVDLNDAEEKIVLATIDPIASIAATDKDKLKELFDSIETDNEQIKDLLQFIADRENVLFGDLEPSEHTPRSRKTAIDAFFTLSADSTCCTAVLSGLKYGTQSGNRICPYEPKMANGLHNLDFIDSDYQKYDHVMHRAYVAEHQPKYATVRDLMTKHQCGQNNMPFYSFTQIMEWADELAQSADNVIVIPKYDCLDKIDEKYVIGFSIPTTHGGTRLPIEMFKGRRVHLLGGSWRAQLKYLAALEEDVVSLDNNHIMKIANYGQFVMPDGKTKTLGEFLPMLPNHRVVALAISFGAIVSKLQELYGQVSE